MRKLFFGIPISKNSSKLFLPLFHTLTRSYPALPFSPPNKRHMTIHFIGNVTEKAYEKIIENFKKKKLPRISPLILGGNPPWERLETPCFFFACWTMEKVCERYMMH